MESATTQLPATSGPAERTALYRIFGAADLLIYIGISRDFGRRWKQHTKAQPWWDEHRRMTVEWHDSRPEAEAAEEAAIKAEKPQYNKTHAVPPVAVPRVEVPELWVGDGDAFEQMERIISSGCKNHALVMLLISAAAAGYRELPVGQDLENLADRVHVGRSTAYRLGRVARRSAR